LDAVVANIVSLQLEQIEVLQAQADEIAAVREKYRATLTELDRFLQIESAWVETWARQNPNVFSGERTLRCTQATIGFRTIAPQVERASRKWSWTEAALKLAESAWGRRYLRIPAPEVNKEAILNDQATLSPEALREVGIKIVQGERFYLERHGLNEEVETTDSNWQEAA
jgi:phage host-nuclease inhibitor protein Gam